jgi:hypothetical protein
MCAAGLFSTRVDGDFGMIFVETSIAVIGEQVGLNVYLRPQLTHQVYNISSLALSRYWATARSRQPIDCAAITSSTHLDTLTCPVPIPAVPIHDKDIGLHAESHLRTAAVLTATPDVKFRMPARMGQE